MYNDLIPFELNVDDLEDMNYEWKTMGDLFSIEDVLDEEKKVIKNQIKTIAPLTYNGLNVNSGISCILTNQEKQNIANIYIPIHCYLNRYGFSQLNEWDGNSIKIDENGGFILAPQLAAGVKNQENAFTGLLMGEAHASNWSEPQNGLFGFNNGQRTLFLDAETGGAIFGTSAANISIGGASNPHSSTYNRLWLYSFNFWKSNAFNEKGFLKDNVTYQYNKNVFNWSGKNGAGNGLLIDFNKPAIIFGNGNFSVENGGLRARDAILKGKLTLQNSQDVKIGEFSNSGIEFFYDDEEMGINVSMGGIFTETIKAPLYSDGSGGSAFFRGMSFLLDNSSYSFLNGFMAFGTREKNNKSNYALTWGRISVGAIPKGFTFNDVAYFKKDIYIEKKASFDNTVNFNNNWYSNKRAYFHNEIYLGIKDQKNKDGYFEAPKIKCLWNNKYYTGQNMNVELEDGRWLHFIGGILIAVNRNPDYI